MNRGGDDDDDDDDDPSVKESRVRIYWDVPNARSRVVIPPLNFAIVSKGVYRSGFPNAKNFAFLKKQGMRSILYLSPEEHGDHSIGRQNLDFIASNGIKFFNCPMGAHKEPFGVTPDSVVAEALAAVIDTRNHPILIHCDKGKHRTGCLVGCLRKLQGWSLSSIFDEYARFCKGVVRDLDLQFIELCSCSVKCDKQYAPPWLGNVNER